MAIGGVNGALDFGNLASGVGGEGTGIVRRCHTRAGTWRACASRL